MNALGPRLIPLAFLVLTTTVPPDAAAAPGHAGSPSVRLRTRCKVAWTNGELEFDIRNVFVLESTGPAHVRVDNIRFQRAFNTEPEWWQINKTCDLLPWRSHHRERVEQ